MAIEEARRLQLHTAARERLGEAEGDTLMEMLPPAGDEAATRRDLEASIVATRDDLKDRITATEKGLGSRITAAQTELDSRISRTRDDLRTSLHRATLASVGLLIGAIGIATTLIVNAG